jgi:hypothetical protein
VEEPLRESGADGYHEGGRDEITHAAGISEATNPELGKGRMHENYVEKVGERSA